MATVPLARIINQSLPIIERQVGVPYDKYRVESQFRWSGGNQQMAQDMLPQIRVNGVVDVAQILAIECLEHDQATRAFAFASLAGLEDHLIGSSSFLNPIITYVIPIIGGRATDFDVLTEKGDPIIKHLFDEDPCRSQGPYSLSWHGAHGN